MKDQFVKIGALMVIVAGIAYYLLNTPGFTSTYFCTPPEKSLFLECSQLLTLLRVVVSLFGLVGLLEFLYGLVASDRRVIEVRYPDERKEDVVVYQGRREETVVAPREEKKEILVACPKCKAKNKDGVKFCSECGERMTPEKVFVTCPKCKAKNEEKVKFCVDCGAPMKEEKKKKAPAADVEEEPLDEPPEEPPEDEEEEAPEEEKDE